MWEYIGILIVFGLVLLLCYYTTRLLGKKFSGSVKNKVMNIVETLPLGFDRCLYVIRAGKKHYLFCSSKKGLEYLTEIEVDEETMTSDNSEGPDQSENRFSFRSIFENYSGLIDRQSDESTTEKKENKQESLLANSIQRLRKINSKRD